MKKYIFIILVLILGFVGCSKEQVGKEVNTPESTPTSTPKAPETSSTPIKSTRKPIPKKIPKIIVNDPLLELDVEEFRREYAKLPDDYELELGFTNEKFNSMISENEIEGKIYRTITKKQAEQIKILCGGDYDEDEWGNIYEYPDDLNFQGLRYFTNLEEISFWYSKLRRMSELKYITNLKKVYFEGCDLGIKSSNGLKGLANMKKVNITIDSCNLKEINFLKYFSNLNRSELCFSNNEIEDISPLINLKETEYLILNYNNIKDIQPLSNLSEVGDLFLSDNKISNIHPLSGLKRIRGFDFDNNLIEDISVLSNYKNIKSISLAGNRIRDLSPLSTIMKKDKKFEILDLSNNCILDYSSFKKWIDNYHISFKSKFKNWIKEDTFYYEGMKWHFNMIILGRKYDEKENRRFTFFELDNKDAEFVHPACNIIMFFKAIGGSSKYDEKKGILTCDYLDKSYTFHDFSNVVKIKKGNKKMKKNMQFEMKHMEGDLPFATIEDLCTLTGLQYQITSTRKINATYDFETIKIQIPSLIEVKK